MEVGWASFSVRDKMVVEGGEEYQSDGNGFSVGERSCISTEDGNV